MTTFLVTKMYSLSILLTIWVFYSLMVGSFIFTLTLYVHFYVFTISYRHLEIIEKEEWLTNTLYYSILWPLGIYDLFFHFREVTNIMTVVTSTETV